jgi:hypothetical protein
MSRPHQIETTNLPSLPTQISSALKTDQERFAFMLLRTWQVRQHSFNRLRFAQRCAELKEVLGTQYLHTHTLEIIHNECINSFGVAAQEVCGPMWAPVYWLLMSSQDASLEWAKAVLTDWLEQHKKAIVDTKR